MCVDVGRWWYPRFKDLKELWNKHLFHIFLCEFKIKTSVMHEYVMNNQEYVMNNQEHVKNT